MAATGAGVPLLVGLLLKKAISQSSNGPERTAATGIRRLVGLLKMAIALSSNGQERTAATGCCSKWPSFLPPMGERGELMSGV